MISTLSLGNQISSTLFIIYLFNEFVVGFFLDRFREDLLERKICCKRNAKKIINETFAPNRRYVFIIIIKTFLWILG